MNVIQTAKRTWWAIRHARSLESLFVHEHLSGTYAGETSVLDNLANQLQTPYSSISSTGVKDTAISPFDLYDMVIKDTVYSALLKQIVEALFKNGFYIDVAKDPDGNEIGQRLQAERLQRLLVEHDYEWIIQKIVYGELADGGGNVLVYPIREAGGGIRFGVDPFNDMGRPRVKVYGSDRTRKIVKYEVVDTSDGAVYTIDTTENLFLHTRYEIGGDYRFSLNPAKRAVFWFLLKKYVLGANTHAFKNGMQQPYLISTDYSQLKVLLEAMNTGKVNSGGANKWERDLFAAIRKLSKETDRKLMDHTGNTRNTGQAIRLPLPIKVDAIGRNNKDMQTHELIDIANKEMAAALRTPFEIINPEKSKYANAEIGTDNWESLVLTPLKRKIEQLTETFILPILDPLYRSDIYPVRFGRDPDQEAIDIFRAKTERVSAQAEILTKIAQLPGYTYNLETNDIEKVEAEAPEQGSEVEENDAEQIAVESGEHGDSIQRELAYRASKKKESPSEKALRSGDAKKFQKLIEKSIARQLKTYVQKLKKRENEKTALAGARKDMPSITKMGLSTNTFKQQLEKFARVGVEEVESYTGEKRMQRAGAQVTVPPAVSRLMDIKAQITLHGIDSVSQDDKDFFFSIYSNDELKAYAGIDEETTNQILTILQNAFNSNQGISRAISLVLDAVPRISNNQATRIAETEIPQAIEATRFYEYTEMFGLDQTEKAWRNVGDNLVRDTHRKNESDGWIGAKDRFSGGELTPADAFRCRCWLLFRRKYKK